MYWFPLGNVTSVFITCYSVWDFHISLRTRDGNENPVNISC